MHAARSARHKGRVNPNPRTHTMMFLIATPPSSAADDDLELDELYIDAPELNVEPDLYDTIMAAYRRLGIA